MHFTEEVGERVNVAKASCSLPHKIWLYNHQVTFKREQTVDKGYNPSACDGVMSFRRSHIIDRRYVSSTVLVSGVAQREVKHSCHNGQISGLEDLRLFKFGGKLYAICSYVPSDQRRFHNRHYIPSTMALVCFDDTGTLADAPRSFNVRKITSDFDQRITEKNWCPLVRDDGVYLVYDVACGTILKLDLEEAHATIVKQAQEVAFDNMPMDCIQPVVRGGTQYVWVRSMRRWLSVGHVLQLGQRYSHVLITLDENMSSPSVSAPFRLHEEDAIQYASGIEAISDHEFLVYVGLGDVSSEVIRMRLEYHPPDAEIDVLIQESCNVVMGVEPWEVSAGNLQSMHMYGQAGQDRFVLNALKGKKNGTFVEVGSGHPSLHNNTFILEHRFVWTGVMIEQSDEWLLEYKRDRPRSRHLICDATTLDLSSLLDETARNYVIDYLQVDLDIETGSTLAFLSLLDGVMRDYKFAVITFEHDYYRQVGKTPENRTLRTTSREMLSRNGYVCVFHNVSSEDQCFEDWWVHPTCVDMAHINSLMQMNTVQYMTTKGYHTVPIPDCIDNRCIKY
jgi:hypothetical protein